MNIGVPKEIKDNEYRVSVTPGGVHQLVVEGHRVLVQEAAGQGSGFADAEYRDAGAEILSKARDHYAAGIDEIERALQALDE